MTQETHGTKESSSWQIQYEITLHNKYGSSWILTSFFAEVILTLFYVLLFYFFKIFEYALLILLWRRAGL